MRFFILLEKMLQKLLPKKWRQALGKLRVKVYWVLGWLATPYFLKTQTRYRKVLEKLRGKEKYRVAFFVFQDSIWKYDSLYQAMAAHSRFDPVVVVIPYVTHGHQAMVMEMERTAKAFEEKKYKVIKTYNPETDEFLDVNQAITPDIVFFTSPFRLTLPQYQVSNFTQCLTAYVPYGIMSVRAEEEQYNQLFHNLVWRCYYETPLHKEMAQEYSYIKARNVVVSGYPLADLFLGPKSKHDGWKNRDANCKRIVWAPHHTLEKNITYYGYSNFLTYHEYFFTLVEQFNGKIQVAFKPHPILKLKLYNHPDWGVEKTNQYFERWETTPYCQLSEGDYIALFLSSDALIHDSISFISEYCYTGKPALFLLRDEHVFETFNKFGLMALQASYHAREAQEIFDFIEQVVIQQIDPKKNEREEFLNNYLRPPHGVSATQNILDDLTTQLNLPKTNTLVDSNWD